ncbi:MAG TPA: ABC transporter ATP-binding protein, partial [Draconibacterium sp.]|nr:ABC transporter ATP-binding protein [Draconibacterium sp.]
TLLITAVGLLLFILLRKYLFKAFYLGEEQIEHYNRLLKYIDDFWQTIKIAKVHSSEKFYYDKFENASSSLLNLEFQMEKNYALPNLIYRLTGVIVLVLIVYLGYRFNQVPLTSFFILIILFARIYPQFTGINTNVNMISSNLASVKLVMQLDSDFPEPVLVDSDPQTRLKLENEISIENMNFAYPGGEILFNNFNASIPAMKMTGIVGESGIGKTTFIDLIAGLQKPTQGEISVDGHLLDEKLSPGWKASIGYLPQDSFFIDGTIRENLVWDSSKNLTDNEIWDTLKQVNAAHLVKRLKKGLDEFISNYQYHFSGGERQRLALARVLLRHPNLLLLDEATSSLDTENEKIIMEILTQLKKSVTILFVTHRTSVLPWFDRIIHL